MTISTTDRKVNHIGNGTVTEFFYTYRCDDESWMIPFLDDVQVFTGFTVNLNSNKIGGSVVFDTAPEADVVVTLARATPQNQNIDYQSFEPFPADTHETGFDKLTMMIQELQEVAARSINLPVSDDGTTSVIFPSYSPGDNIGWCQATKEICNIEQIVCPPVYVEKFHELIGKIDRTGNIIKSQGGFTVEELSTGVHKVTFNEAITEDYAVVVSIAAGAAPNTWGSTVYVSEETNTHFKIGTEDDETGVTTSRDWSFQLVWETA